MTDEERKRIDEEVDRELREFIPKDMLTEEEFKARGVNIVIYANQLTRSAFPAMKNAAETILRSHRALEIDSQLMPFKDIIRLIDEL